MPKKSRPKVDPYWIRGPVDHVAIEQGCYFDEEAASRPCDFIQGFCRQSKGRWKGQPLTLLDWQIDFEKRLFGWKLPSGLRRYRRAYLEVAKKNGKSTLISGTGLELLIADDEGSPEIYLNACDKEQAGIIFEEERRMVEASPDLSRRLQVFNSKDNKRIIDPEGNGAIIANSSIAGSKDGLNPSATIFDELHRQPDRQLWDVFEYAGAAREQPIRLSITTAGEVEDGPWYEERQRAEQVNSGAILDTSFLGVVYRAKEEDDIDDPATWAKANPSLGQTIRLEDFQRELLEAKQTPTKLANFKRLRLNIVTAGATQFVSMEAWRACGKAPSNLSGQPTFGGLDLSSTTDLSALVWIVGDQESGFDAHFRFFLPEDNIVELEHKHGVPYRTWAQSGYIILTPGNVIDYAFIRREVRKLGAQGPPQKLLIDPYNATETANQLKDTDGFDVEFLRQGFLSLSEPTKALERLTLGGLIRHGNHPVMNWMASNAIVVKDDAGNVKLSKKRSKKPIDGMAALVNALAGATSGGSGGGSVYDSRGILTL